MNEIFAPSRRCCICWRRSGSSFASIYFLSPGLAWRSCAAVDRTVPPKPFVLYSIHSPRLKRCDRARARRTRTDVCISACIFLYNMKTIRNLYIRRICTRRWWITNHQIHYSNMSLLQSSVIRIGCLELAIQSLYYEVFRLHHAIKILPKIFHVFVKFFALYSAQNKSPLFVDLRGVQSWERFLALQLVLHF